MKIIFYTKIKELMKTKTNNEIDTKQSCVSPVIGSPKFIPILFSTPMVRALLDGRKTQTRRIVKYKFLIKGNPKFSTREADITGVSPYGKPGDILWVRETFVSYNVPVKHPKVSEIEYEYKADETPIKFRWKPGIHMPKEACRLFLKVKSLRVERLHDITESDAKAEGCEPAERKSLPSNEAFLCEWTLCEITKPYRNGYALLWEQINGRNSWEENPWVWVIEFIEIERPTGFL